MYITLTYLLICLYSLLELDVSFSCEQRLQREQIVAALRKLDSGEISFIEFQDKVWRIYNIYIIVIYILKC